MKNPFRNTRAFEKEKLIAQAFKAASAIVDKESFEGKIEEIARQKEGLRIKTVGNIVHGNIKSTVRSFPVQSKIPQIYQELIEVTIGMDRLKKSLAALNWTANRIKDLQMSYHTRMKRARHTQDMRTIRKDFYGRLVSLLEKAKKEIRFIYDNVRFLRSLPDIDDMPTVTIAGLPNVGKSSLLFRISGSKPDIQSYSFTTKGIMSGHAELDFQIVQFLDTPGILDRPLAKRNKIELQALTVFKMLSDLVIYVFDVSETCGYTLKKQLNLYEEFKGSFEKPIIPVVNKVDILGGRPVEEVQKHFPEEVIVLSCETGEGIGKVRDEIIGFFRLMKRK